MSWEIGLIAVQAVAGIICRGDKILIAERPPGKPYAGYWEFPGGKIEAHETSLAALKRELYEELAVQVVTAKHLFTHEHLYPDKLVKLDIWLVQDVNGEPQGKEQQTLCWINWSDITTVHWLEGNITIIDKIKKLSQHSPINASVSGS